MTKTTKDSFTHFNFEGFKNIGIIDCDSEWLWNYLRFLEWDSEVKSYFQPRMWVVVEYARMEIEVKIDMWVNHTSGASYLIHFKNEFPVAEELPAENIHVQAACKRFCEESNLHFHTVDQSLSEPEPRNGNVNLLWQHARRRLHLGHLWLIDRFFSEERSPNIGKFKVALSKCGYETDLVYTLLFHRIIDAEIDYFPFSHRTPLFKGAGNTSIASSQPEGNLEQSTEPLFDLEILF